MPLDDTQIKTRLGNILEGATAHALVKGGFKYRQNWQYDEAAQVPDFFLPDTDNPNFVIEVHQTDARDSFRMKTLRAFTAVMEAKSHFGDAIISINILFGDPDTEVPLANVNALCGFFDVNIIPRKAARIPAAIVALEAKALECASDEDINVEQGVQQVARQVPKGIAELADILKCHLPGATRKVALDPLWQMERKRTKTLGKAPLPRERTYYKRTLLKSVYLSDDHFAELVAKKDPNECSPSLQQQLIATKLVEVTEGIDGDHLVLEATFRDFLRDPLSLQLRELCKERLDEEPAMKWFFEDIRNKDRREKMVLIAVDLIRRGKISFKKGAKTCFENGDFDKIEHCRCWLIDLYPLILNRSHNYFNGLMFRDNRYKNSLGNPYPNIAIRSERLGKNHQTLNNYIDVCTEILWEHLKNLDISGLSAEVLSNKLLKFRIDASIKFKKLDTLQIIVEKECRKLGITFSEIRTENIVSDIADEGQTSIYQLYALSKGSKAILMNFIAVHDHHGDDKSKEWGARRRATLYRLQGGMIRPSEYQDALFVLDGEWEAKDVNRLYRSGWNRICRLGDLEETLKNIFKI